MGLGAIVVSHKDVSPFVANSLCQPGLFERSSYAARSLPELITPFTAAHWRLPWTSNCSTKNISVKLGKVSSLGATRNHPYWSSRTTREDYEISGGEARLSPKVFGRLSLVSPSHSKGSLAFRVGRTSRAWKMARRHWKSTSFLLFSFPYSFKLCSPKKAITDSKYTLLLTWRQVSLFPYLLPASCFLFPYLLNSLIGFYVP